MIKCATFGTGLKNSSALFCLSEKYSCAQMVQRQQTVNNLRRKRKIVRAGGVGSFQWTDELWKAAALSSYTRRILTSLNVRQHETSHSVFSSHLYEFKPVQLQLLTLREELRRLDSTSHSALCLKALIREEPLKE